MKIQAGIYQHYKGELYQVFGTVQHSESQELLVLYQCLYGDYGFWVRPLKMFVEQVCLADGQEQPRFRLIQAKHPAI